MVMGSVRCMSNAWSPQAVLWPGWLAASVSTIYTTRMDLAGLSLSPSRFKTWLEMDKAGCKLRHAGLTVFDSN